MCRVKLSEVRGTEIPFGFAKGGLETCGLIFVGEDSVLVARSLEVPVIWLSMNFATLSWVRVSFVGYWETIFPSTYLRNS